MKKIIALLLTLTLLAVLFIVPASAADTVTIEFWTVLTGGDGDTMQSMVDLFNQSQTEVHVNHTPMLASDMYEKVELAVQTQSEVPDVCLGHFNHIPQMVDNGTLTDLSALTENGIDTANYPDWLIKADTINGLLYGIPFDVHGVVAWANLDLLKKYGLSGIVDDRCLTFDEIAQCGEAIKAAGDAGSVYVCNYYQALYLYLRLYEEKGGVWLDENGAFTLDNDIFTQVIKDLRAINEAGYTVPVDAAEKNLFINGQSVFYTGGTWAKSWIQALSMNYMELIPMSYSGDTGLISCNSHQFIQPVNDERTAEEDQAVAKFVQWMGENSNIWAEKAGQVAVHSSVTNSEGFKSLPQAFIVSDEFAGHTQLLDYYYSSLLESAMAHVGLNPIYDTTIDPSSVGPGIVKEINDAIAQK